MNELTLELPRLSDQQQAVIQSDRRFNIVGAGRNAGKLTLAVEVALTSERGAIAGYPVAFFVPDADRLIKAKRRIVRLIDPLLSGRPAKTRIDLVTGGSIQFFSLETGVVDLWDQVALIVVVGASEIDGLVEMWEDALRPSLSRYRGHAWIFAKPQGSRNGFGRLFREAMRDDEWHASVLTSVANPRADLEEIEKAKADLSDETFMQEYGGEVVDGAIELSASQTVIGRDESFIQWCDRLAEEGLKVDGMPFKLDDRPAMRWVYELVPSTIEEAFGKTLILMKCAQVGFTVMEMLAMIYLSLKFMPCKIGMYLPDMKLAGIKSSERFMPVVRTIPRVYGMMTDDAQGVRRGGEGNVMVRNLGGSRFHFMWTSGKAMTESIPLDVVSFDEVQEMSIADMEKTRERMSASRIRFTLMGSTANWPDRDIHFWYKLGSQHQFWTRCPECGTFQILDDHFPDCIRFDDEAREYRYCCHKCNGWIDDSQDGEWRPANPDSRMISVHFPQFLSPTISPREIIEAYFNADDLKNFWNRKRGKPYTDPSQVPVNLEMLNECAKIGVSIGIKWKARAKGTFMGIDQMGNFNVAIIKERLPDNRQAVIHVEFIYSENPFARCDELMTQYGVACCVCEGLPNFNDAWAFAKRHKGKVFIAGYSDMADEMLRWGDSRLNAMDRKTDEDSRVQYTVTLDQYKCMQTSMARFQNKTCLFPDPQGLNQEISEKGVKKTVPVLKDLAFLHFTRTALVAEKDEEQKKYRRKVVKVGIDPHTSYANMLCDVAWARAFGTNSFILPDGSSPASDVAKEVTDAMPGLPSGVVGIFEQAAETDICGKCANYDPDTGLCVDRGFFVKRLDPACLAFIPAE